MSDVEAELCFINAISVAKTQRWRRYAACSGLSSKEADRLFIDCETICDFEQAVAICETCPVEVECLDDSMLYQVQGVRGGTSEQDRQRLRRKMLETRTHFLSDVSRICDETQGMLNFIRRR